MFRGHILKMWVDAGRRKDACENENERKWNGKGIQLYCATMGVPWDRARKKRGQSNERKVEVTRKYEFESGEK